jgi:succinyldiaminopimelate transaminase
VPLSPVLAEQSTYPFVRLEEAKQRKAEQGVRIIDFGMGDPKGVPEEPIRRALAEALESASGYPAAQGLPELREAIADWLSRRFGVTVDPDRAIVPTLGSKEAIFSFAQVAVDRAAGKDLVLVPDPGYPVYERGAQFAGAEVHTLPLRADAGFLPDLDAIDAGVWRQAAVVWVNYPNNPTTATAPLDFLRRLADLAREHDFYLCSDEAYSELWFAPPPPHSALEAGTENVVVFNTLSKRSSMTGYRSGFVAGDERAIAALKKFRPTVGTAPQLFVQRASIVAWGDEEHVERTQERYRRRREPFVELFARKGLPLRGAAATMYLWVEVPSDETSEAFAARLLEHGIVVAPGSHLGRFGEGYVRVALVPPEEECEAAVEILDRVL